MTGLGERQMLMIFWVGTVACDWKNIMSLPGSHCPPVVIRSAT